MSKEELLALPSVEIFRLIKEKFGILVLNEKDIRGAWDVVKELSKNYALVETTLYDCGHNSCRLGAEKEIYVEAATAPLAICQASLIAVLEDLK